MLGDVGFDDCVGFDGVGFQYLYGTGLKIGLKVDLDGLLGFLVVSGCGLFRFVSPVVVDWIGAVLGVGTAP